MRAQRVTRVVSSFTIPRRRRLSAELLLIHREVADLASLPKETRSIVEDDIRAAEEQHEGGNVDAAWQLIFHAQESLVLGYNTIQLDSLRQALGEEVKDEDKFTASRRVSIRKILDCPAGSLEANRERLRTALRLRNEGVSNQYWRLSVTRHYQLWLLLTGTPVLVTTIVMLALASTEIHEPQWAFRRSACILSVMLGALGATTSAAQRSTRVHPQRIIVQLVLRV